MPAAGLGSRLPERSSERDAAIEALAAGVPFEGWTLPALRRAAGPDADLLFPGGSVDMAEAFVDLADRRMLAAAPGLGLDGLRLPARVRALVLFRLDRLEGHRDPVRRALSVLSLHPLRAAAVTARTMDAIWQAAGDQASGASWYTKRVILAGVYGSTLLAWIAGASDIEAFLDRRLDEVRRFGQASRRMRGG